MQIKVNETTRNKNKPESGKEKKAKEHKTREQSDELKDGQTSEIAF